MSTPEPDSVVKVLSFPFGCECQLSMVACTLLSPHLRKFSAILGNPRRLDMCRERLMPACRCPRVDARVSRASVASVRRTAQRE